MQNLIHFQTSFDIIDKKTALSGNISLRYNIDQQHVNIHSLNDC